MFFGKHSLPLTENKRLTLPSGFREGMGHFVYVTQGFDQNLLLLPQPAFNAICANVKTISITDPMARLLNRLFLGSAEEVTVGKSGQIELPGQLCEYASLGEEVIVVGQGDYLEVWSPNQWQKQIENIRDLESDPHRFEKFHVSLVQ